MTIRSAPGILVVAWGLCAAGMPMTGVAAGQSLAPQRPPTQAIDAPADERAFGDWDGLRNDLGRVGIALKLDAVTEFAGNLAGGSHQTAGFANQIGFGADINWERLAGVTGLSTLLILVNRSGTSASRGFGDNLLPVQEIYGSGGDVAVHFVSGYAQETLFDRRLDVAVGRMNVENDFGSSPLYCSFMNNALCGEPKALPAGDIGHSAYPDAVWAARLRLRPLAGFYFQTGVYEVNQGLYSNAYYRSGFRFDTSQDSGAYLPVEAAWEPTLGSDKLPGHYKLGFGYDTSAGHQDFANALAKASVPGYLPRSRAGNFQVWALADQMLVRHGTGDDAGLIAMAGLVVNDAANTAYADQYFMGAVDRGFWARRPRDAIALLFTYVGVSDQLAKVQAVQRSLALPVSNAATGVQSNEMILEADYQLHLADGITFMPDFQYVIRPNAQSSLADAPVLGFRAYFDF